MAKAIEQALSDPSAGSCFFAVGTAHYVGKKSVVVLLRAAGYKVTLVEGD